MIYISLGPVVNILAIFSNANILKIYESKNIPHQRYRLSVIDFDYMLFLTKEQNNKKEEKMIRLEPRLDIHVPKSVNDIMISPFREGFILTKLRICEVS